MLAEYSEYMPLGLLILVSAFLGYLIWRGNYKIGAYIVQVGAALFLSSVAGFALYVMSAVMVTTWIFTGSSTFLMVNSLATMALGTTAGFAIVKRYGTASNQVKPLEIVISLVLGVIGAWVGFVLFKDADFAADFVTNANSVAGAYFGALLMGNSPLIVGGLISVLRNQEP